MDTSKFNLIQYFPFLAIIGVILPFWQQTKNFILKFFRIFWKQRVITADFSYKFYEQLTKDSYLINFDDYNINQYSYYSLNKKRFLPILMKMFNFEICLYKKFIPILIFGQGDGYIKIQYLKFTFDFETFLSNAVNSVYDEWENQDGYRKINRFWIYQRSGKSLKTINSKQEYSSSDKSIETKPAWSSNLSEDNKNKPILEPYRIVNKKIPRTIGININDISVNGAPEGETNKYQFTDKGEYVFSQVERWLDARNWYEERNINWRRGILLNGKPGNGKSSLVLEIARKLSIPLYVFDLSSMDNIEFDKSLSDMSNDSAIILFEDFDNVFNGRNNITKTQQFGGLTFDMFINKLSGVNCIKNKFIFITTNHLDKIDPAILRPGRIDEKIEILPLNLEEKLKMARIILNNEQLVNKVVNNSEELSTAEFENKCVQLALNTFWNRK